MEEKGAFDFRLFEAFLKKHDEKAALDMVTPLNSHCRVSFGYGIVSHFCEFGSDDVESLHRLLKCGASLELDSDRLRWNPLHEVAYRNKPKLTRVLLDLCVPVDILTKHLRTPLHFAISSTYPSYACAFILIDAGAQINKIQYNVPPWVQNIVAKRASSRSASLALLCVGRCGGKTYGNGKDVFCIIARCVWSTRGVLHWSNRRNLSAK